MFMAVVEAKKLPAIMLPPAALLPQLCRLHNWHEQFLGTGCIHLLPDNLFNLPDGPKPQGKICVKP